MADAISETCGRMWVGICIHYTFGLESTNELMDWSLAEPEMCKEPFHLLLAPRTLGWVLSDLRGPSCR